MKLSFNDGLLHVGAGVCVCVCVHTCVTREGGRQGFLQATTYMLHIIFGLSYLYNVTSYCFQTRWFYFSN